MTDDIKKSIKSEIYKSLETGELYKKLDKLGCLFMNKIKSINKETELNIVFYESGGCESEIFLVELLLNNGYKVNTVHLIDYLYDILNPTLNPDIMPIINMQCQMKKIHNVKVILYNSYENYANGLEKFNEPIHLIIGIHIGFSYPTLIQIYKQNMITQRRLEKIYKSKGDNVPHDIIIYGTKNPGDLNDPVIEKNKNIILYHLELKNKLYERYKNSVKKYGIKSQLINITPDELNQKLDEGIDDELKPNLYLKLKERTPDILKKVEEKLIKNIELINKKQILNIVFYDSKEAYVEIYLVESLLNKGYLIGNVYLIDSIYSNLDIKLLLKSKLDSDKELNNLFIILNDLYNTLDIFIKYKDRINDPLQKKDIEIRLCRTTVNIKEKKQIILEYVKKEICNLISIETDSIKKIKLQSELLNLNYYNDVSKITDVCNILDIKKKLKDIFNINVE